ncbi:PfkB family carbohydrate kinase [Leifsonia sp. NPDC014704]|uniref:PfkB family carbohydrate kinase n=1 Tax=Leifsonia sp. NPDC014704 TaxID=3364123 RepID=UPI0036F4AF02
MILALALSPSVDVTYEVAAVKPQAVNRVQRATKVAGGKALNAARAAAALGASVRAVIPLGGEPGAWIARELQRDGVDATVVPLEAETRTCVAVVADDGAASSTDFYEPATPLSSDAWAGIVAAVEAALTDALPAWLLVSGSVPPGIGLRDLARLLDQARAAGVRTASTRPAKACARSSARPTW